MLVLEKKHINEWFMLFDSQTFNATRNKNNAENKQIAIEELSLLVWPIDGWEKRGRGSLVLAKRQGDD
jgi:hypothetical protein